MLIQTDSRTRYWASAALILTLAGCEDPRPTRQEVMAGYAATCTSYGFQSGSTEHAQCMMQTEQAAMARRASMPPPVLNTAPIYTNQMSSPMQTRCTQDYFGTVNCRSY